MEVHHRLTGCLAHVDANVVAGRVEFDVQLRLDQVQELEYGDALLGGSIKPGRDVATRDDESMARTDRKRVADSQR
jgi:hypothetical protein